jgi:phosphoenolpyruvate carboxykinase (diphosphate)
VDLRPVGRSQKIGGDALDCSQQSEPAAEVNNATLERGVVKNRSSLMVLANALGLMSDSAARDTESRARRRQVLLHLLANGLPVPSDGEADFEELCKAFHESFREKARLLGEHRCPADQRIEAYLQSHFADLNLSWTPRLPSHSLILDQFGIARELSLPIEGDSFSSALLTSYRVKNGVLHNPKSDRRTTQGTFHVAEGGLPVPGDKKAIPKRVFAELFRRAVKPPVESLTLPFAAHQLVPVRTFVSLLLRPIVCPEVPGVCSCKTMEVRFFAPGSLVSNLDFVESIFGNAGNPYLPRNDAGLDVEHWTGHTGCVILAPHLLEFTKKELGLPHWKDATERQKRDKMCWKDEGETYNDGTAFKLTCRTEAGVIITLLADNYYGYCKKEVKTQISYAANLYGNVEEEHAGGAIAFASFSFGDEFQAMSLKVNGRTFEDVKRDYAEFMDLRPEGYGVDWKFPDLVYVPEDTRASTVRQQVWWMRDGKEHHIPLLPGKVYMTPSGFKLRMEKHPGAPSWRLVGARGDGSFCHKPCTVSGGGKSEISKSLRDYMLYGPIFVGDLGSTLDLVEAIFKKDYSDRWRRDYAEKPNYAARPSRLLLHPERSLGSVIKMLSPSQDYSDEYNAWLASIPNYIYPIVFIIKRFYKPEWEGDWRSHFSVDIVNGFPGNELKFEDRKLIGTYLRVGLLEPAAWRTYKVRQDFAAASKVQTEDDISASVVVPAKQLIHDVPGLRGISRKFVVNCEYRLFQRPDDAVHRGLDKQTEIDMARSDNFISNFEPLTWVQAQVMVEKVTEFDQFTDPMRRIIQSCADAGSGLVVSSASPRLVDGKPSKNPRYLQIRPDLIDPMSLYVAEKGMRLFYAIPSDEPVLWPVDSVLMGRRNNPAEPAANIRGLAVYNPIHYQELPEMFMDLICSLTGKSPSTTGAGSEGALTKSPFNALRPTIDLNNALVSYILTGLGGFSTAAGYIGPKVRVDHDISLLVPEIWCRLTLAERDPDYLIAQGHLEPLKDFDFQGEKILASRLGYRVTAKFVQTFFGRIFDNPSKVFDEAILRPETQDAAAFADGVKNITEAHQRVARDYLKDGSIADACPPLKALLRIMAEGSFEGKDANHPEIRAMFTKDYLLQSDWYKERLKAKQRKDIALWKRHLAYLETYIHTSATPDEEAHLDLPARRSHAAAELSRVSSPAYLESLVGTLGADPSC